MRKILIVEDDTLLNRTLGYNLTSDGYNVTLAYNYKEAVQYLKKAEYNIALLDINLPDGSGLDLCEEIRGAVSTPTSFLLPLTTRKAICSKAMRRAAQTM